MMQSSFVPGGHRATFPQRDLIHDIRNLFGVVASASHILEREPPAPRRLALLGAIEEAAIRGGELTSGLLANVADANDSDTVEIADRLTKLGPMAQALAGTHVELDLEIGRTAAPVRMVAPDFDATVLELVANAVAARASVIVLRSRRVGARVWIMVADDGAGMSASSLGRARAGQATGGVRGTGLARVRHFVRATHGHVLVRSRPGAGTTIVLNLPTVLKMAASEPGVGTDARIIKQKEKTDEDRQPVTV